MTSRRVQKAAEAVREVVSMAILTEMRDPRVSDVTVTGVEMSGDMRNAKVRVSVMGNENKQQLTLRGLQNAAGFLQAKLNDRIEMRYTPRLTFELDQGVKRSLEVARILSEVLPSETEDTPTSSEEDCVPEEEGTSVENETNEPLRGGTSDDAVADTPRPPEPGH